MLRYRLSAAAQADILEILGWSEDQFGEPARLRYERLIVAALRDVATRPERPGSLERPELGPGVRSWHLRLSRDRTSARSGVVRNPRHFIVYRIEPDLLVVGRVLHDAMELVRHMSPEAFGDQPNP
jgi:toxin ParE1/3/4